MSEYYLTKDELYHHGVQGQKWGVRQYQNKDGSLTPAGREHYGYSNSSLQYKKGLREATLKGGLIGRAKYKKEHSKEAADYEQEKSFLKSAKKIRKKEGYRDRIVKENTSQILRNNKLADRNKAEIKDLKKYGAESDTYKKYVQSKKSSYTYAETYGDLLSTAIANGMTSAYYKKNANLEISKLIDRKNENSKRAIERAKAYTQSNEQLMSMPITEFTKKKDIRRKAVVPGFTG